MPKKEIDQDKMLTNAEKFPQNPEGYNQGTKKVADFIDSFQLSSTAIKTDQVRSHDVSTYDMLLAINGHKWLLIICMAVVFGCCSYYLKYYALMYSSSVSFMVNESPLLEIVNGNYSPNNFTVGSEALNRIQYLVISNDMLDHLIKKFSLDINYGIDPKAEFAYEKTLKIVMNCINVKRSPNGLITIMFSDMQRYRAAEIANEICVWLDTLNKKLIINTLRRRLDISKTLIADIGKDNRMESSNFDTLLTKLNNLFGQLNSRSISDVHLFEIQQRFLQNIFILQNSTEDLVKARKAYELAIQMVSDRNLPYIIVITTALPAETSNLWKALSISAFITVTLFSIYLFILYILKQYKNHFLIFFRS